MVKKKRRTPLSKKFIPQASIVSDELYIPNHSGEHTAGTTGTPVDDRHIANKKYVDDKNVESFPTSLTAGSIVFSDGTNLAEDNSNFTWDDTNKRLILSVTPAEYKLTPTLSFGDGNTGFYERLDNRLVVGVAGVPRWFWESSKFRSQTVGGPQLRSEAASSTNPVFVTTDDDDTGMGNAGADIGCLIAGGINVLNWDDSGNVGIGTASPGKKLDINTSANDAFRITDSLGSTLVTGAGVSVTRSSSYLISSGKWYIQPDGGSDGITILDDGKVGVGTATPTIKFSVTEKCGNTSIGGFAIKLTNRTGVDTIAGQLVKASTVNDDAAILTGVDDVECFGVFLETGISNGEEAWVVVSGICDVAMDDNTAATRGNWVETSEAGYADATAGAPPGGAVAHWQEIGHCIETVSAGGEGTHILARCVLHFN